VWRPPPRTRAIHRLARLSNHSNATTLPVDRPSPAAAALRRDPPVPRRERLFVPPLLDIFFGLRVQRTARPPVLPQRPRPRCEKHEQSNRARFALAPGFPPVAVVVAVIRGHAVPAVPELALVTRFHAKRRGARPATGAAGTAAAVVGLGLGLGLQRESPLEGTGKGGQGLGMCLVMDEGTFFFFFLFQPLLGAVS
jgi:hypothetical protein